LKESISTDLSKAIDLKVTPAISISCLDQVGPRFKINLDGKPVEIDENELFVILEKHCGVEKFFASYGPTRENIKTRHLQTI
jgi:hypothetical protein